MSARARTWGWRDQAVDAVGCALAHYQLIDLGADILAETIVASATVSMRSSSRLLHSCRRTSAVRPRT